MLLHRHLQLSGDPLRLHGGRGTPPQFPVRTRRARPNGRGAAARSGGAGRGSALSAGSLLHPPHRAQDGTTFSVRRQALHGLRPQTTGGRTGAQGRSHPGKGAGPRKHRSGRKTTVVAHDCQEHGGRRIRRKGGGGESGVRHQGLWKRYFDHRGCFALSTGLCFHRRIQRRNLRSALQIFYQNIRIQTRNARMRSHLRGAPQRNKPPRDLPVRSPRRRPLRPDGQGGPRRRRTLLCLSLRLRRPRRSAQEGGAALSQRVAAGPRASDRAGSERAAAEAGRRSLQPRNFEPVGGFAVGARWIHRGRVPAHGTYHGEQHRSRI
mmetsp:Transcript_21987/g.50127  ORF Transcript_21987/g.50127 Transcript_21987/m.50127 type:complete len:321 (+) Transcript_21987:1953-2915(+)